MYVQSFPKALEDGILYVSLSFSTACHSCCCGCGTKIVTPIRPTEYRFTEVGGLVSLYPSIGNWNHPCQSHYVIRNGKVIRAAKMRRSEIDDGRAHDEAVKRAYYSQATQSWITEIWNWVKNLLR